MCLIVVAHRVHPRYPLVLAANRDEFYQRPTLPAGVWEEHPTLIAGRDLRAGGTWLGVTRSGRIAAVTNVRNGREQPPTDPRSRGALPLDFLLGELPTHDYAGYLNETRQAYAGFNLLAFDGSELGYYSNRHPDRPCLAPGVYGVSNAALDTPWPKLRRARSALAALIDGERLEPEALFALLADATPAPAAALPDTGIAPEWEALLSSCFIRSEEYGTRSSTLILRDNRGDTLFIERNFTPGLPITTQRFELSGVG